MTEGTLPPGSEQRSAGFCLEFRAWTPAPSPRRRCGECGTVWLHPDAVDGWGGDHSCPGASFGAGRIVAACRCGHRLRGGGGVRIRRHQRGVAPGMRGEIRVWGGLHLPSVGSSILLVWVVTQVAHGPPAWLLVGFTATSTYLLVIGLQFWLATHRGHVPEPQNSDDPGRLTTAHWSRVAQECA